MKTTRYISIMAAAAGLLLTASCVKDTLYDTPHPDYGKIAVTADWSARGEGIDIPAAWTVSMDDYTGTETSATHAPDHLFAPGSYTLAVWNPAEGIRETGQARMPLWTMPRGGSSPIRSRCRSRRTATTRLSPQ